MLTIGRNIYMAFPDLQSAGCRVRLRLEAGIGPDSRAASWTGMIGCSFTAWSRARTGDVLVRRTCSAMRSR